MGGEKELKEQKIVPSVVPGVGTGGITMCPYGFQKGPCLKSGCEMFVELYSNEQPVGRCAVAWQVKLTVELREELGRLGNKLGQLLPDNKKI